MQHPNRILIQDFASPSSFLSTQNSNPRPRQSAYNKVHPARSFHALPCARNPQLPPRPHPPRHAREPGRAPGPPPRPSWPAAAPSAVLSESDCSRQPAPPPPAPACQTEHPAHTFQISGMHPVSQRPNHPSTPDQQSAPRVPTPRRCPPTHSRTAAAAASASRPPGPARPPPAAPCMLPTRHCVSAPHPIPHFHKAAAVGHSAIGT